MRLLLVGMMLLGATPAMATDQFDLVCTGRNRSAPLASWRPIEKHYRIDLAKMQWCQDRCQGVDPIAKVEADKITFRYEPRKFEADGLVVETADRRVGTWVDYVSSPGLNGLYWESEGVCSPAPFTPFPKVATKF
jgi:hypothetical protein